jgi:hypothetical protein
MVLRYCNTKGSTGTVPFCRIEQFELPANKFQMCTFELKNCTDLKNVIDFLPHRT